MKTVVLFVLTFVLLLSIVSAIPFNFPSNFRQIQMRTNQFYNLNFLVPNISLSVLSAEGICTASQGTVSVSYRATGNFRTARAGFTCSDSLGQFERQMRSLENRNVLPGVEYNQRLIFANLINAASGEARVAFSGQLTCSVYSCTGNTCVTVENIRVNVPRCLN